MLTLVVFFAMLHQGDLRKVEVSAVRIQDVTSEDELEGFCGRTRIAACTRFVAYQLSATCAGKEKSWSILASARFIPYMFLFRRSAMTHEMLHVRDVRESAADFIHQLEEVRFENRDACETAASQSVTGFEQQMQRFVRASNEKRRCGELRR